MRNVKDEIGSRSIAVAEAGAPPQTESFDPYELTPLDLSVVMPCLNESLTLGICIKKAIASMGQLGLRGEVIIADNGSTDGSQQIARELGARVVNIETRGYGSALRGGIAAARGRFIIMGDADDSYDFSQLGGFVDKLSQGYDLVMGNRFHGGIVPGAMPFLHRYLGNPGLSWLGRLFFRCPVGDFQCGLRGFHRDTIEKLQLQTTGHGIFHRDGGESHALQFADCGNSHDAFSRRARSAAAFTNVARRMAVSPVSTALQSAMAFSVSGHRAFLVWRGRVRVVNSRPTHDWLRNVRLPHAAVWRDGHPNRLSVGEFCRVHENFRYH